MVVKGTANGGTAPIYNAEYNPTGQYDAISFCDGAAADLVLRQHTGR